MKNLLLPLLLSAASAFAGPTLITSYGTTSGEDDADQAYPLFGQAITASVGANTKMPQKLKLQSVSFQSGSRTDTQTKETVVYLHVYEDFQVNGSDTPEHVGKLVAVSQNSIDMSKVDRLQQLTWNFSNEIIDRDKNYHYIISKDTKPATASDSSNLIGGAFELNTEDPYKGGDCYLANSSLTDWDLEFEVKFNSDDSKQTPVAVTPRARKSESVASPAALISIGNITLSLRDTH